MFTTILYNKSFFELFKSLALLKSFDVNKGAVSAAVEGCGKRLLLLVDGIFEEDDAPDNSEAKLWFFFVTHYSI